MVYSLSCTILDSTTKCLKESDLVMTQPSNKILSFKIEFENPNTTVWKSKNNSIWLNNSLLIKLEAKQLINNINK